MTNRRTILIAVIAVVAIALVAGAVLLNNGAPGASSGDDAGSASSTSDSSGDDGTAADSGNGNATSAEDGDSASSDGVSEPNQAVPDLAEPGDELKQITTPPPGTLAMLSADRLPADTKYDIVFRPYGIGPGADGTSLVIVVTEGKPQEASAEEPLDLNGKNMLVALSAGTPVPAGGVYRGVITFAEKGDVLSPELGSVRPASSE